MWLVAGRNTGSVPTGPPGDTSSPFRQEKQYRAVSARPLSPGESPKGNAGWRVCEMGLGGIWRGPGLLGGMGPGPLVAQTSPWLSGPSTQGCMVMITPVISEPQFLHL